MTTPMTSTPQRVDVERLTELLARATPGPWRHDPDERFPNEAIISLSGGYIECGGSRERREANAELIEAMHEALPALLQQLAEQRDELATLQVIHNCLRRDHERSKARAESAERAREEACGLLRESHSACMSLLGLLIISDITDGREQTKELASDIAAFLAANGGRDEA